MAAVFNHSGDVVGAFLAPDTPSIPVVPVFHHVLRSSAAHFLRNFCPAAPILLREFEKEAVLLDSPSLFGNIRVEVIHPLFTALVQRAEKAALGNAEELI